VEGEGREMTGSDEEIVNRNGERKVER